MYDSELSLPHYILFRKGRSRHGGGIAIYISASLNPSVPFSVPSHSLEFLSLSFTFLKRSFHIGCFYRPPTSSSDLLSLTNLLLSAGPSFTSRLILVGDFNVNLLGNPSHLSRHNSLLSYLSSLYAKLSLFQLTSSTSELLLSLTSFLCLLLSRPRYQSTLLSVLLITIQF